ncbi:MAG: hypothetical protein KF722_05660 [Nitrospira sp.]|nr:hypothetical protein [Nitrospira sp.]
MRRSSCVWTVVGLWFIATLSYSSAVHAAENVRPDDTDGLELICLTEQPAIVEGDSVGLRAWGSRSDGQPIAQPITFEWQVTEGRIQGTGANVRWDLTAAPIKPTEQPKKIVAIVHATVPSLDTARCQVEIFIGIKSRGGLISARQFLLPNKAEKLNYGLYSYLLFSAPPKNLEEKARYLRILGSCLSIMQDIDDFLERQQPPGELNATYIPVTKVPKPGNSSAEWAENTLAAYDYAAAQILLSKLSTTYQDGPYLISVLKPLSKAGSPVPVHLFQDFTGVVPDHASNWVKHFTYLAAQQRSWQDQSLRQFHLKMRNLLAVAGIVTPELVNSVKTLVQIR